MSSTYVREQVVNFIQTEVPTETLIDLTAEFEEISDLLEFHEVDDGENWIGIQFIGSEEIPVDIRATNGKGTYKEIGVFYIHVVAVAKLGGASAILSRGEAIRNKFRGQRIGPILIESVSPCNFGDGISLNFEGGYTSGTFTVAYEYQFSL